MLYDPKWDRPVDVMSLQTLIAWLETKPPEEAYDYMCTNGSCFYSQYLTAHGVSWKGSHEWFQWHTNGRVHIAVCEPWTFGAALTRARAMLAEAAS